ncbi:MAG: hypothetical protein KBG29_16925 [Pseudomonadales bacterium]|jgi:hypothetical protein|nr:hypothetical protein [Pseudomonadales bacterium]
MDRSNNPAQSAEQRPHGVVLPLLLALLTLLLWFGFQTSQLLAERERLDALNIEQQSIHANALQMRAQLDAIATGTVRLAQQGNTNAAQVMQALAKKGVTISPNAPAGTAPSAH